MYKLIILILALSPINSFSYEIEKEGDWFYMYNGNDLVGAYSKHKYGDSYTAGCGDPKKSSSENKYFDGSGYYMYQSFKTTRESQNAISKYCNKKDNAFLTVDGAIDKTDAGKKIIIESEFRGDLTYERNQTKPFTGIEVNVYPDGTRVKRNYVDGKKNGLTTFWYANGQKQEVINYVDGKKNGLLTGWFKNGQKMNETNYVDDNQDGSHIRWLENGQKDAEGNYVKGTFIPSDLTSSSSVNTASFINKEKVEVEKQSSTDDIIHQVYKARLGEKDHFSSSGKRLTTAVAILRQDRANFHVFNVRDAEDESDEIFKSKVSREYIEKIAFISKATEKAILNGTPVIQVKVEGDSLDVTLVTQ